MTSQQTTLIKKIRETILQYELARLTTFSQNPEVEQTIHIDQIAADVFASHFPEVGYFNMVLGLTTLDQDTLKRLRAFYNGYDGPVKAGVFPHVPQDSYGEEIARYVRLYADLRTLSETTPLSHPKITIVLASAYSQGEFAALYLEVFEASPVRRAAALSNLARLSHTPGIYSYIILQDGVPAGISILFVHQEWGYLAGGGVLPQFRRQGLHHYSLQHRLNLAKKLGCKHIISWTYSQDQSCNNMLRMGLKVVFEEPIYLLNFQ